MPPSNSQIFLRIFNKKGAQASRLFLQEGKATGKMPVLLSSTGKLIDDARALRSDHTFVVGGIKRATGMSPLPNSFTQGQHPDLRAHSNSFSASLSDLCAFAVNSSASSNFARVLHMPRNLSRHSKAMMDLAPNGSMALLLANDSMSSNSSGEGDIRRVVIEAHPN